MQSTSKSKSNHVNRAKITRTAGAASLSCAVLFGMLSVSTASSAFAAEAKVNLGSSLSYSVLAGETVTNTGQSIIAADLGTSPGTSVTGFPPGIVAGSIHAADEHAALAQNDLLKAYDDAETRDPTEILDDELVGRTLPGGVYKATSSLDLNGTLTLDGEGNPDSVWVFQVDSALTTGSSSNIQLVNGASSCNVFWQVGSSATLGSSSYFAGSILANTSVTVNTDAIVEGRALARTGAVTLDNNLFLAPDCGDTTPEEGEEPVPLPEPDPETPVEPGPVTPVDPPVEPEPVEPPVDDEPVTPPVDDAPVTPPVDDAPVTPPVDENPGTPPVDETPVDNGTGDEPTDPSDDTPVTNPDEETTPVVVPDAPDFVVPDEDLVTENPSESDVLVGPDANTETDVTYDENGVEITDMDELPETGSTSTGIFAGAGAAFALAGGILLFLNSRSTRSVFQK